MLTVTLTGLQEMQDWIESLPASLQEALVQKSGELADSLIQKVQSKLDGDVLAARSGLLRDSIQSDVSENDGTVTGSVFVGGDVPYAAIQEYGGQTKAHIIEATKGKALAFSWGGKQAFFRSVQHPGSLIPERSYLRSSLQEMQGDITAGAIDALSQTINQ